MSIMKVIERKALAKFVPAAAVKRIEQVYLSELGIKRYKVVIRFSFNKRLGFNPRTINNNVLLDYDRNI